MSPIKKLFFYVTLVSRACYVDQTNTKAGRWENKYQAWIKCAVIKRTNLAGNESRRNRAGLIQANEAQKYKNQKKYKGMKLWEHKQEYEGQNRMGEG